jgi:hypothetical protein
MTRRRTSIRFHRSHCFERRPTADSRFFSREEMIGRTLLCTQNNAKQPTLPNGCFSQHYKAYHFDQLSVAALQQIEHSIRTCGHNNTPTSSGHSVTWIHSLFRSILTSPTLPLPVPTFYRLAAFGMDALPQASTTRD